MSYARDEAGLLARGDEARMLATQNAELASRVASIAERLDALERLADARPAVQR